MPFEKLLEEVQNLKDSSNRLGRLADEHPTFTDGLLPISASVLKSAIILEILILSRSGP